MTTDRLLGSDGKKTGLFFGSFNPVHIGHLIVADQVVTHTDLDELWFVVSPHSPFKETTELAPEAHRLAMVDLSLINQSHLHSCDVEFDLEKPSYTVDTLHYLRAHFPQKKFTLVLGSDNMLAFEQWKNHLDILAHHEIYVYNRPEIKHQPFTHPQVKYLPEMPLLQISSTYLRACIRADKSIRFMTPDHVITYIMDNGLYRFDVINEDSM